jgi:hypothetical protein
MMSNFRLFRFVAVSAWVCTVSTLAVAQEPNAAKLYDQGVNAYFGGRACQADSLLSDAIKWNSQDPRAYYFRALSLLRQGRVDEARGDMLVGAMVEAQLPHRYAIGAALERVQGADRLMLEHFRNHARQEAAANPTAIAKSPVQNTTFVERDAAVLREKRVVPLEELLRPGGPQTVADEPADSPQAVPPQGNQPAAKPIPKPESAPPDPFADDSQKPAPATTPPANTTPAKTPPQAAPEPTPPAAPPTAPPAGPGEDPFK